MKLPKGILALVELGLLYKNEDISTDDEDIFYFETKTDYFTANTLDEIQSLFNCSDIELNIDFDSDVKSTTVYLHYLKKK